MKSLSRDELIEEVKYGRMSPAAAEAKAAKLGFGPLARTPDPGQFSPMEDVGWTLPMAVAWIAWRDPQKVLQFYDPYRAQCFDWHFRKWRVGFDGPIYDGHFLEERPPATLVLLSLSEHIEMANEPGSGRSRRVREAESQLWKALQEGRLEASGIPRLDCPRVGIPAHEWHDLKAVEEGGRDVLRDGRLSANSYDKIVIARQSVLALWPRRYDVQSIAELPPTVRPEGPGDFPLYCAAQWIATEGGTRTINPADPLIWDAVFDELKARIASGHVNVTGVRNGKPERIEPHIFSSALRVGLPLSEEPLDLILSDELYLHSCVFLDAEHWHRGFNDTLQTRAGIEWSKLTVLKSDVLRWWSFSKGKSDEPSSIRTGAPGRPTPIHLVLAEHRRRLERDEAEQRVTAEAEHLAAWLKQTHPDVPSLTAKTIQNRIRSDHRTTKKAPK